MWLMWITLGLVAGLMAHRRRNASGQGIAMDIVLGHGLLPNALLGVGGAVLGGWLGSFIARLHVADIALITPLTSLVAAVLCADLLLASWQQLTRGPRRSQDLSHVLPGVSIGPPIDRAAAPVGGSIDGQVRGAAITLEKSS